MTETAEVEMVPCFLCSKSVEKNENYCYGCKQVICENCSVDPTLGGPHEPEAHLNEDWQ